MGDAMSERPILIIGLGNPILGDDGIGWVVADRVKQALGLSSSHAGLFDPARSFSGEGSIEIDRLSLGGLSLMERFIGYRDVVLVDSIHTGRKPAGFIWTFSLDEMGSTAGGHMSAPHDASLKTALRVGYAMGADLPAEQRIYIVAVETEPVLDFSENLSEDVAGAVEGAVRAVCAHITRLQIKKNRNLEKETSNGIA